MDIPWQSAFLSEEFISASHCFDQAARLRESIAGHIHIFDFHFYSALSLTVPLIAEQYTPDVQNKVVHHYQQIAGWANENPGTFSDKEALLSAEICRLEGKSLPAMEKYETAIRLSQEGGFIHINALCHELAGNFAHYAGLNVAADAYFKKAINAWREWGAAAKVRQLERKHPYLVTAAPVTPFNTISFAQNETVRDLESVVTAIRALTEEINLDRLINTLMMMLLERAGAQRCLLIRILDNNLPETEAKAVMTPDGIRVDIVNEAPTATDLPLSVLSAVIRTGQEIRTGKPEIFSPFSQDPYLVASGAAVMCSCIQTGQTGWRALF
ncbi:hypothetical protein O3W44_23470 [Pantoea sp. LMR881]|uniref:hypothetical protein n=1 Tax=Pantoea sp. LMR881 TaxID=3014336 RepID=UPI0022AF7AD3|nr:hypothetical protein [Pantoea sp. LMR881]MCZ4061463.1 hypothetical protein [Pantoea sp. LMR881]